MPLQKGHACRTWLRKIAKENGQMQQTDKGRAHFFSFGCGFQQNFLAQLDDAKSSSVMIWLKQSAESTARAEA